MMMKKKVATTYMNESLTSTNRNVLNKLDSVQKQQIILLKAIQ